MKSPTLKELIFENDYTNNPEDDNQLEPPELIPVMNNLPDEFNLEFLENLKGLEPYAYIQHLIKNSAISELGRGNDRTAYSIKKPSIPDVVIKVSNNIHQPQNAKEVEIWECSEGTSPVLAKIFSFDSNRFIWLIMKKADTTFKRRDQKQCFSLINKALGINNEVLIHDQWELNDLLLALKNATATDEEKSSYDDAQYGLDIEKAFDMIYPNNINNWTKELVSLVSLCDLGAADLHCLNWGLFGGELKLIDYGISMH